jgi:hypothetical protein
MRSGTGPRRAVTLGGLREFARTHHDSCRCPHPESAPSANFRSSMAHLLPILRRYGLAAKDSRPPPFADVLALLDAYMVDVKGLSDDTRAVNLRSLATVLTALMRRGRFDPARLTAPAGRRPAVALARELPKRSVHRLQRPASTNE